MKSLRLGSSLLILASTCAVALAEDAKPAEPAGTAPAPAYTEAQLMEEFGWFVMQKTGLTQMQLTPAEAAAMAKGAEEALNQKDSPYEIQKIGPAMSDFVQKKQMALMDKLRMKNLADDAAFFTKLEKENKNVVATPDGLRYEIIAKGDANTPKPSDTVKVNYTGKLLDGTVFDSSERGGKPLEIPLGQTIPGWIEGLQKIGKGGKIKLYIPPQLAYGDAGQPGIPPSAALIFDVELVDFTAAQAGATITVPQTGK